MAPTPADREPRCVAGEFDADPFGRVAVGVVVDLHRPARKSEHRQRNGGKCKMVIQHDAEEARDQDLVGQRGGGQYKNREIMAAEILGNACKTLSSRSSPERSLPGASVPSPARAPRCRQIDRKSLTTGRPGHGHSPSAGDAISGLIPEVNACGKVWGGLDLKIGRFRP